MDKIIKYLSDLGSFEPIFSNKNEYHFTYDKIRIVLNYNDESYSLHYDNISNSLITSLKTGKYPATQQHLQENLHRIMFEFKQQVNKLNN